MEGEPTQHEDEQAVGSEHDEQDETKLEEHVPDPIDIPEGTGELGLGSQSGATEGGTQEVRGLPLSSENIEPAGGRVEANKPDDEEVDTDDEDKAEEAKDPSGS